MSIRNIGKNKWILDFYPKGRKGGRVRSVYNGNERGARDAEMRLRRINITPRSITNPKIIDIMPEYFAWLKLHRAETTHRDIKYSFKYLRPYFGNTPISHITPMTINKYKESRKNVSNKTINKELTYLKSIISFCVRNDYGNKLPFKIEMLPYKRPIPKIPHPIDIQKFIDEVRDPVKKAMVLFMYQAGLRYKEVKNIRWENIEWRGNRVNLEETKGSEPRICLMTDDIRSILEPIRKERGFVFENPRTGKPYGSLKTMFRIACKRAKINKINPHLLRHAFGTYTLEATKDLRLVQKMLGHKNITMTEIYTHIATERMKDAMKKTQDYIKTLTT